MCRFLEKVIGIRSDEENELWSVSNLVHFAGVQQTELLFRLTADAINHPWLQVLPTPRNGAAPLDTTMSASDLLNNFYGQSNSNSTDSSPVTTMSKPPVAGLGSAISLDQSPRPYTNGFEGEGKESDDSLIDSQAIGASLCLS